MREELPREATKPLMDSLIAAQQAAVKAEATSHSLLRFNVEEEDDVWVNASAILRMLREVEQSAQHLREAERLTVGQQEQQ